MADLKLGRTMQSNNGSQDSLLRSVKQQINQSKFKGKVNDDAINAILQAIATQQENQGKYQLELASKNNDAIVNKIKDALEKLYEAQQNADSSSSASDKDNNNLVDDIVAELKKELANLLPTKDDTNESKDTTASDFKKLQDTIDDIKSTLDKSSNKTTTNEDKKQSTKETSAIEVPQSIDANVDFTTQFEQLQNYIDSTFKQLNDSLQPITSVNDMIQQSIIEMSSKISDIGKASFNAVAQPVTLTLNELENFTKDLTISLVNEVSSIKNALATVANDIVNVVSSKISEVFTSVVSLGKNILGKVTAPFKGLSDKLKGIGASLKDGFKNLMSSVGGALKSIALAPLKLVGGLVSSLNPFKKKKQKPTKDEIKLSKMIDKVNDFIDNFFDNMLGYVEKFIDKALKFAKKAVNVLMTHIFAWLLVNVVLIGLLFGFVLKLIAKPLMEILQPIMDFIDSIVGKILDFLKPVRDFLINVFQKVWDIISPVIEAFFTALKPFAAAVAIGLGLFVQSVLNVLKLLMDGIASGAEALGKALVTFATAVVDVLALFMKGLSSQAEAIGIGLGKFVSSCLNVLTLLMDGIGTQAKAIGEAIGKLVLALVEVATLIVDFAKNVVGLLTDIVKIIRKPIQFLADFFNGIGTRAKQIGEKMGDIILKVLTKVEWAIDNLTDLVRLYVIAPLKALQLKIRSGLAKMADYDGWGSSIVNGLANAFGWGSLSDKEKDEARNAEGKSIGELVNQQMEKMRENIAADKAAKEAEDLAKQLQQKQIENLLANQHKIDDILAIAINNNEHLVEIGKHFGVEIEPPKIEVAPPKVDVSAPEIDAEELNASSNSTASKIDKLTEIVQPLPQYMKMCMSTIQQNLDSILDKLDDKPNLLPIPLMENSVNAAMMENM